MHRNIIVLEQRTQLSAFCSPPQLSHPSVFIVAIDCTYAYSHNRSQLMRSLLVNNSTLLVSTPSAVSYRLCRQACTGRRYAHVERRTKQLGSANDDDESILLLPHQCPQSPNSHRGIAAGQVYIYGGPNRKREISFSTTTRRAKRIRMFSIDYMLFSLSLLFHSLYH